MWNIYQLISLRVTGCGKLLYLHGNLSKHARKARSQESLSVKATCLNESSFIRVTQHHQTIQMTSQHNSTVNTLETSVSTEFLKI